MTEPDAPAAAEALVALAGPSQQPAVAPPPALELLQPALSAILRESDWDTLTYRSIRTELRRMLGAEAIEKRGSPPAAARAEPAGAPAAREPRRNGAGDSVVEAGPRGKGKPPAQLVAEQRRGWLPASASSEPSAKSCPSAAIRE